MDFFFQNNTFTSFLKTLHDITQNSASPTNQHIHSLKVWMIYVRTNILSRMLPRSHKKQDFCELILNVLLVTLRLVRLHHRSCVIVWNSNTIVFSVCTLPFFPLFSVIYLLFIYFECACRNIVATSKMFYFPQPEGSRRYYEQLVLWRIYRYWKFWQFRFYYLKRSRYIFWTFLSWKCK